MLGPGGVGTRTLALIVLALVVMPSALAYPKAPADVPGRVDDTLQHVDPLRNGLPDEPPALPPAPSPEVPGVPEAPTAPELPDLPDIPEGPAWPPVEPGPAPELPSEPVMDACARVSRIPIATNLFDNLGFDAAELRERFEDTRDLRDECHEILA